MFPGIQGIHPIIGVAGSNAASYSWTAAGLQSLNIDDDGWTDFTLRQTLLAAYITPGNFVRFSLGASTTQGLTISKAYIGILSGAQGFVTPVQATFSGSAGFTIAAGATAMSDPIALTIAAAQDICISAYCPAAHSADDGPRRRNSPTAGTGNSYFKAGDDASNASPSGYSGVAANAFFLEDFETST